MKIACIFCDMLRSDKISVLNKKIEETKLDKLILEKGGTLYRNAFSPNPDTGRALANFFTGKLNKSNGCFFQYQYLKNNNIGEKLFTLKDLLEKNQFYYKFIVHKANYLCGGYLVPDEKIIPIGIKGRKFKKELIKVKEEEKNQENSFIFLGIEDYHLAVDNYSSSNESVLKGKEKIGNTIENFFNVFGKDYFDYVFIFSDHGHKDGISRENLKKSDLNLLGPDRTRIFMWIRKKGDKKLIIEDSVKSIADFMPTFSFLLKETKGYNFDGENIFINNSERIVALEGNEDFFDPYSKLSLWGAVSKKYIYLTDKNKEKVLKNKINQLDRVKISENEKSKIIEKIERDTCNFKKEIKKISSEDIKKSKMIYKKLGEYGEEYIYSDDTLISFEKYYKSKKRRFKTIRRKLKKKLLTIILN